MTMLLREDVLAWLAAFLLGGCSMLAALELLLGSKHLGRGARWCAGLGGYLLLLSLTARGVQVRGWPLVSTYEAVLLTAATLALYYALGTSPHLAAVGGVCSGLSTLLLVVLALLLTPAGARTPKPPPAALRGWWFPLHALCTGVGYGGLVLAGVAGLFRALSGRGAPAGSLAADLEDLAHRALCWGYPWLSAGMVTGALWGWLSWGWYWTWSVKEVLTLLTWGTFTLAFHTRRLRGWRGRPHAAVLVGGLIALLVTLLAAEALARRLLPTARYIF